MDELGRPSDAVRLGGDGRRQPASHNSLRAAIGGCRPQHPLTHYPWGLILDGHTSCMACVVKPASDPAASCSAGPCYSR